jgi:hypothetical protein
MHSAIRVVGGYRINEQMRRTCSPIYGRIFRHCDADFDPRASRQERLRNAISALPASVFRSYRTTLTRIFQIHSEPRLVLLREVWLRGDYRATNRQSSSVWVGGVPPQPGNTGHSLELRALIHHHFTTACIKHAILKRFQVELIKNLRTL